MKMSSLLVELSKQKLMVRADNDNLVVYGNLAALTPELKSALLSHKFALLEVLKEIEIENQSTLTAIVPRPEQRFEPFPLTDIQLAYWVGRQKLVDWGGVASHYYEEFDCKDLMISDLERSLNELIERHDMLRLVFTNDVKQQVLEKVPYYRIERSAFCGPNASNDLASHLAATRERMSNAVHEINNWPLFEIALTSLSEHITRLHISIDLLIADFQSLSLLAREWYVRYLNPGTPIEVPDLSFRDYVLAEEALVGGPEWVRAKTYWEQRLETFPDAPSLPLKRGVQAMTGAATMDAAVTRFDRTRDCLEAPIWSSLKRSAKEHGLSASSVLMAAFAEVLATWSRSREFTVTVTQVRRLPLHAGIESIIGDFTTASLCTIRRDPKSTFVDRARAIQHQLLSDLENSLYSAPKVVGSLRSLRESMGQRISFPVVFTSALPLAGQTGEAANFEAFGEHVFAVSQTPQVWFDHVVTEAEGRLTWHWDIRRGIYPDGLIADMWQEYSGILRRLATDSAYWDHQVKALPTPVSLAERERVNRTETPVADLRLHELFERSVARYPLAIAVSSPVEDVTYRELARRAKSFAQYLLESDVCPGSLVAVAAPSGVQQIVAVLAVLMAGSAYVPLSHAWPRTRAAEVLTASGARHVVLPARGGDLSWIPSGVVHVFLEECEDQRRTAAAISPRCKPDNLAYVIFTSGSTGRPKGVAIEHGAVTNTILDINQRFGVRASDRILAVSDFAFDLSVFDIFGALAEGACIVTIDEQSHGRYNPAHWLELIERRGVSIWNSAPAVMGALLEYLEARPEQEVNSLRIVMLSGDWIPVLQPGEIKRRAPKANIYSLGGATEASIWSIYYPIETDTAEWVSIPYGIPLANQSFHVFDDELHPCPRYVPGELYIGGAGLAREYWREPELTNASFIQYPTTGERLYRTGDMGRYLENGIIEFLGRSDNQTKIAGFRVELGEIESKLLSYDEVSAAVVVVLGSEKGPKRIAAAVVPTGGSEIDLAALRGKLANVLPIYMVPAILRVVDRLPITPNGKIDRRSLEATLAESGDRHPRELDCSDDMGSSDLERQLARELQDILGRSTADSNRNFFDLGATSLDLIKLHSRIEGLIGRRISPVIVFSNPTIRSLASAIDEQQQDKSFGTVNDDQSRKAARSAYRSRRRVAREVTRVDQR